MPGEIRNEIFMGKIITGCVLLILFLVSGCSQASRDGGYTAGDLSGINHMADSGINSFSVNGYGGTLTGNSCCIMLPEKWSPGLKARVEWETDPNPNEIIPMKKKGFGYVEEAYARHAENYQQNSMVVEIPQYGKERCGLTVHFLPCNQVKVTTSCYGFNAPEYPIKEPFDMKEPSACPVK